MAGGPDHYPVVRKKQPGVQSRSIYIGDRETCFRYIAENHTDIRPTLVAPDTTKRMAQCLAWHRAVLLPAVKRLVLNKNRLRWQQAIKDNRVDNAMLFSLNDESEETYQKAFQLSIIELKKFILPAIEDQLLIRNFFCESKTHNPYSQIFSLADLVIFHELFTALVFTSTTVEPGQYPNTSIWLEKMQRLPCIENHCQKLLEFVGAPPLPQPERVKHSPAYSQSTVPTQETTSLASSFILSKAPTPSRGSNSSRSRKGSTNKLFLADSDEEQE